MLTSLFKGRKVSKALMKQFDETTSLFDETTPQTVHTEDDGDR